MIRLRAALAVLLVAALAGCAPPNGTAEA